MAAAPQYIHAVNLDYTRLLGEGGYPSTDTLVVVVVVVVVLPYESPPPPKTARAILRLPPTTFQYNNQIVVPRRDHSAML
jgi:hypothetical protein